MSIALRFEGINNAERVLRTQKAKILRDLRKSILSLPENQKIKVLSNKPRCFVMNFSDLDSRDWTPEYYNFKKQYQAICREIRKKEFKQIIPFLKNIIKTGKMKKVEFHYWWGTHRVNVRVNIHPQVIENIKGLL